MLTGAHAELMLSSCRVHTAGGHTCGWVRGSSSGWVLTSRFCAVAAARSRVSRYSTKEHPEEEHRSCDRCSATQCSVHMGTGEVQRVIGGHDWVAESTAFFAAQTLHMASVLAASVLAASVLAASVLAASVLAASRCWRRRCCAEPVDRDASTRACRVDLVLLFLLVANDLHLAVACQKARLVSAENKVIHYLAEGFAIGRETLVLLAQEVERCVDA